MDNTLSVAEHVVMGAVENEMLTQVETGAAQDVDAARERAWQLRGAYTDGTSVSVAEFEAAFDALYHYRPVDTATLFTRDGAPFTGTVRTDDKGKPYFVQSVKCCRCGGSGEYSKFHGTCWRCGGRGQTPNDIWDEKLYTQAQLDKLNAAKAKAQAKRAAAAQVVADAFDAAHADLFALVPAAWLNPACDMDADPDSEYQRQSGLPREAFIVVGILNKGRHFGSISDKQRQLVVDLVARHHQNVARDAAKAAAHAAVVAQSQHVGTVGEKLSVVVTCTKRATFSRPAFNSFNREETVVVCTFTDAQGNVFVTKTPRFSVEQGAQGTLTGTVKAHSEYQDVKQTQLLRCKFVG